MANEQVVYVVDDDAGVREGISLLLQTAGLPCQTFSSAGQFLSLYDPGWGGCIVLDIRMPKMNGLELQSKLKSLKSTLPIIFITGHGDIPMAVEAMRSGALDFIRKPFKMAALEETIQHALAVGRGSQQQADNLKAVLAAVAELTKREFEVFQRVSDGQMNKAIAIDLGISERTVEVHRSQVMKKLNARNLAELVRIRIASETSA